MTVTVWLRVDNEGIPGSGPAAGGDNEGKTEMEAGGRLGEGGGEMGRAELEEERDED